MKSKWLYVPLVLSLAVNAGVLGVILTNKVSAWRHMRWYAGRFLKPGVSLGELDALSARYSKSREAASDSYEATRRELGRLGEEPAPDSLRVEAVIGRLAAFNRQFSRMQVDLLSGMARLYKPERVQRWRDDVRAAIDSARSADQRKEER